MIYYTTLGHTQIGILFVYTCCVLKMGFILECYTTVRFPYAPIFQCTKGAYRNGLSLLDKVMLHNQRYIGVHQHHLMFPGPTWDHIWSQKEGESGKKHFHWVISCFISQLSYIRQMTTKASNIHCCTIQGLHSTSFSIVQLKGHTGMGRLHWHERGGEILYTSKCCVHVMTSVVHLTDK